MQRTQNSAWQVAMLHLIVKGNNYTTVCVVVVGEKGTTY